MTDLALAIEQFNRCEYFEQHETLERMWRSEPGPVRDLYRAILQIGVGLYHFKRGNLAGALSLLERGLQSLAPFSPTCLGIDVARFVAEAERCCKAVAAQAAGTGGAFDWNSAPRIHAVDPIQVTPERDNTDGPRSGHAGE